MLLVDLCDLNCLYKVMFENIYEKSYLLTLAEILLHCYILVLGSTFYLEIFQSVSDNKTFFHKSSERSHVGFVLSLWSGWEWDGHGWSCFWTWCPSISVPGHTPHFPAVISSGQAIPENTDTKQLRGTTPPSPFPSFIMQWQDTDMHAHNARKQHLDDSLRVWV